MNIANNPKFIDQNYSIYEKQYAIHKRRFIFFKKGCVNTNVLNSVNTNNSVTFHLSILPTWGNWCQSSWLINTRFIGQWRQTNLFEKNASSQEMLSLTQSVCSKTWKNSAKPWKTSKLIQSFYIEYFFILLTWIWVHLVQK